MRAFETAISILAIIVLVYVIYDVTMLDGESLQVLISYFKLFVEYIQMRFEKLAEWLEPYMFQPEP